MKDSANEVGFTCTLLCTCVFSSVDPRSWRVGPGTTGTKTDED